MIFELLPKALSFSVYPSKALGHSDGAYSHSTEVSLTETVPIKKKKTISVLVFVECKFVAQIPYLSFFMTLLLYNMK